MHDGLTKQSIFYAEFQKHGCGVGDVHWWLCELGLTKAPVNATNTTAMLLGFSVKDALFGQPVMHSSLVGRHPAAQSVFVLGTLQTNVQVLATCHTYIPTETYSDAHTQGQRQTQDGNCVHKGNENT